MSEKPHRVQLRRTKGWRMPENTVKVDRSTEWGNPFVPGQHHDLVPGKVKNKRHAFVLYRAHAPLVDILCASARRRLRGKNLACWCPLPHPGEEDQCHAAVLLEIANAEPSP